MLKTILILPLRNIYEYTFILVMYYILRNMYPSGMTNVFIINNEIHKYMTRLPELWYSPIPQTNVLYKTIKHRSIKLWNDIVKTLWNIFIHS